MIKEYQSKDIDRKKWDHLVSSDSMSRVYSMSWFLDAVTNNSWRALILNDYEAVMPFVVKRKWGIEYCYMPYLAQQFSVFGLNYNVDFFLKELYKNYQYAQISIGGIDHVIFEKCKMSQRTNFTLSLSLPYELIWESYSRTHKKKVEKCRNSTLLYEKSADIEPLLNLFREEKQFIFSAKEMEIVTRNLRNIHLAAINNAVSELYYAKTLQGTIVGASFFLVTKSRIYYLLGASRRNSEEYKGISFWLFDLIIEKYAASSKVLDFEGSDNIGIARFFKGFGSVNEPYSMVQLNDLPFFMRWIKR